MVPKGPVRRTAAAVVNPQVEVHPRHARGNRASCTTDPTRWKGASCPESRVRRLDSRKTNADTRQRGSREDGQASQLDRRHGRSVRGCTCRIAATDAPLHRQNRHDRLGLATSSTIGRRRRRRLKQARADPERVCDAHAPFVRTRPVGRRDSQPASQLDPA